MKNFTMCLFGIGFLMTSAGGGFGFFRVLEFKDTHDYFMSKEIQPTLGFTMVQQPNDSRNYLGVWLGIGSLLEDSQSGLFVHPSIGVNLTSTGLALGMAVSMGF